MGERSHAVIAALVIMHCKRDVHALCHVYGSVEAAADNVRLHPTPCLDWSDLLEDRSVVDHSRSLHARLLPSLQARM